MVNVLIISYNALPMDVVSSYRTKAYCDHLFSFGIRPTLLTHRWEKDRNGHICHDPNSDIIVEETERFVVIRLPYPGSNSSPSVLHTSLSYLRGDLDVALLDSYKIFKQFLWKHLAHTRYECIIAVYNPHFHLKLAYECFQKFGIPYILDFRDLWDNEMITSSYHPGFKKKVIDLVVRYWWRKWIRHSMFFATTGRRWQRFLSELSNREGIIVRNGFDNDLETIPHELSPQKVFKIIHFGSMYKTQVLDIFLDGFMKFADNYSPQEVCFEIVGLKKNRGVDFESTIRNVLGEYLNVKPYMSKDELFKYCAEEATLFFFPDFMEDNGSFAVKVYDYVMMGKNILVVPGRGEVAEFVSNTRTGFVLNQPQDVAQFLKNAYEAFQRSGALAFDPDKIRLEEYSRRNQVKAMATQILSTLHNIHE